MEAWRDWRNDSQNFQRRELFAQELAAAVNQLAVAT
jgi:hypothetical protein